MNPIALCAERTLREHPHPALRLSELAELVAEQVDRTLEPRRLRAILEAHPERFRILDPWRGPWRAPVSRERSGDPGYEVWVVAAAEPDGSPAGPGATAVKLRESVRWLARGIDACSPHEVSRWHAIALAERAVRDAVVRRVL